MVDLLPIFVLSILLPCVFLFYYRSMPRDGRSRPLPPGPRGWLVLGNLSQLGTKPHRTLQALSKIYGPLFRLRFGSVDVVVTASADVASQFLRGQDANFRDCPPNSSAEHVAYNYQDLVFAPYGPHWRYLRKLGSVHLFSAKAFVDLRWVREDEIELLVRALVCGKEPVNMGQALNLCTMNSLARAMLRRRVFEEKGAASRKFHEMVGVELMRFAGTFNFGDFIPWLRRLDSQGAVEKMKHLNRKYDKIFDRIIEEHRMAQAADRRGGKGRDLLGGTHSND